MIWGSPPRMRGKDPFNPNISGFAGITPAYAGKSLTAILGTFSGQDHPRVCGEKRPQPWEKPWPRGSPPRMRGKVDDEVQKMHDMRITPAYAGKSVRRAFACCVAKDHPRVCGEKASAELYCIAISGSPPRMRGKDNCYLDIYYFHGITPAYAGKSGFGSNSRFVNRDHPRVCGEKTKITNIIRRATGSPPRMRGKATYTPVVDVRTRITPAYAGKSI